MRSSHLTDGVVLLRPPTVDDVDAITRACQDPEIAAWVSTPYPYQRSHAVWFVQTIVQPGWQSGCTIVCTNHTAWLRWYGYGVDTQAAISGSWQASVIAATSYAVG